MIDQLPTAHTLTGCDTVTKVGTKLSMLKTLLSDIEGGIRISGKTGLILVHRGMQNVSWFKLLLEKVSRAAQRSQN